MAVPATEVARKWNEAKTRADLLQAADPAVRQIFKNLCDAQCLKIAAVENK